MPLRDNMENQFLFNIAIVTVLACIGWFARQLWDAIQQLKNDFTKLEVDLPTNYFRKSDIETRFDKLEAILNRLFEKIEKKVDR